jgi:hypothetical protein
MENIGKYNGRDVWKVSKSKYEELLAKGNFGGELFAIIEDGFLCSGDTAIGQVNWKTMNVLDFEPRDFVDMKKRYAPKTVKSAYTEPAEVEFHEPSSAPGTLSEADLDMILDSAMHNSVVGGIDLDAIATIGDLDVGDDFRPKG